MKLNNLKETTNKTGVSRATIYRFYEKNPQLWAETKINTKKRLIPEKHLNLIAKNNIYVDNIEKDKSIVKQQRLIDLLSNPNTIEYRLYQMQWDWFCTVSFKNEQTKKYCYHEMMQVFSHLLDLYGNEIDLRIFFTVEPYKDRKGHHIHFILRVGDGLLTNAVIAEMKEYYEGNRVDFEPYDKYEAGLFYIAKEGLKAEDWDIVGNNLAKA